MKPGPFPVMATRPAFSQSPAAEATLHSSSGDPGAREVDGAPSRGGTGMPPRWVSEPQAPRVTAPTRNPTVRMTLTLL